MGNLLNSKDMFRETSNDDNINVDPLNIVSSLIFSQKKRYEITDIIAQGSYSKVYSCDVYPSSSYDDSRYVLKVFHPDPSKNITSIRKQNKFNKKEFLREAYAYKYFAQDPDYSKYILHCYDVLCWEQEEFLSKRKLYAIALERMDGDLSQIHDNIDILSYPKIIINLIYQMLIGLDYVHSKGLVLSDIKEENIFYKIINSEEPNIIIKYGDLGFLSSTIKHKKINPCRFVGTIDYTSPNYVILFHDYQINKALKKITPEIAMKNDIWALGITLRFLIFDQHPISEVEYLLTQSNTPTQSEIIEAIYNTQNIKPTRYNFIEERSEEILFIENIIDKMLTLEYKKRPSCKELLKDYEFKSKNSSC